MVQWELGEREPAWGTVLDLAGALGVEVAAFVVEGEPAPPTPAPPGRPRKATSEGADQRQPKRPRGRPRKAPGVAQGPAAGGGAASQPSGEEGAVTGRRHKRGGKEG